jgi:hypothetical protein
LFVFGYVNDIIAQQAIGGAKCPKTFAVKAYQPIVGANPNIAFTILFYTVTYVVGQAVVGGIVLNIEASLGS